MTHQARIQRMYWIACAAPSASRRRGTLAWRSWSQKLALGGRRSSHIPRMSVVLSCSRRMAVRARACFSSGIWARVRSVSICWIAGVSMLEQSAWGMVEGGIEIFCLLGRGWQAGGLPYGEELPKSRSRSATTRGPFWGVGIQNLDRGFLSVGLLGRDVLLSLRRLSRFSFLVSRFSLLVTGRSRWLGIVGLR